MMTTTQEIHLDTRGNLEIVDITEQVQAVVAQAGVTSGQLTVFVPGSTAGLTTIEYEAGAVSDLRAAIERLAPRDMHYDHDRRWGDGNGHSHVRAALLGPDLHIPIVEGRLSLGTWQQIVLVDCDNRSRHRRLIVSVMGD